LTKLKQQSSFRKPLFIALLRATAIAFTVSSSLYSQVDTIEVQPEFTDLRILKINLTALTINEVKLGFESGIGEKSSLEFTAGFLFPNKLIYDHAIQDDVFLSTGFTGEIAARKYFDKKRYIYQPYFRSYLSGSLLMKYSSYDSTWILFPGGTPATDECTLRDKKFISPGAKILFGIQKRAGFFVIDLYGGLGILMINSSTHTIAKNIGNGCTIIPGVTDMTEHTDSGIDFTPTFNFGIKVGLRMKGKD
jgi:hypothetical protein